MPNDKTAAAQAPATAEKTAGAAPDTAATAAKTAPATTPPTATAGSAPLPGTGRRTAAITVLVTGANGQLGNEMRRIAAAATAPGNVRYLFTDVAELDITDPQAVRRTMRENDVEVIVNCAAYTNVNKAEEDEAAADLLNHRAVANLAAAARERGATLIHISTDYVFEGTETSPAARTIP